MNCEISFDKVRAIELWMENVLGKRIDKNVPQCLPELLMLLKPVITSDGDSHGTSLHEASKKINQHYSNDILKMMNVTQNEFADLSSLDLTIICLLLLVVGLQDNEKLFTNAAQSVPAEYHDILFRQISWILETSDFSYPSLKSLLYVDLKENTNPALQASVKDLNTACTPKRPPNSVVVYSPLDFLKTKLLDSPLAFSRNLLAEKDAELNKLRRQLMEKEELIYTAEAERDLIRDKLETVSNALCESQKTLTSKDRLINDLRDEIEEQMSRSEVLQEKCKSDMGVLQENLYRYQHDLSVARNLVNNLKIENEELGRKVKRAQLLSKINLHHERMRLRSSSIQETIALANETVKASSTSLTEAGPTELTRLSAKCASCGEMENRSSSANATPRASSENVANILHLDELEATKTALESANRRHESDLAELMTKLESETALSRAREAELSAVLVRNASLQVELESGKTRLDSIIQAHQEEQAALQNLLDASKQAENQWKTQYESTKKELHFTQAELQRIRISLENANEQAKQNENELLLTQRRYEAQVVDSEEKLELEQRRLTLTIENLQDELDEAKSQVQRESARNLELQTSLAEANLQAVRLTEQLRYHEERGLELTQKLQSIESTNVILADQVNILESENKSLSQNVGELEKKELYWTERLAVLCRENQQGQELAIQLDAAKDLQKELVTRVVNLECELQRATEKQQIQQQTKLSVGSSITSLSSSSLSKSSLLDKPEAIPYSTSTCFVDSRELGQDKVESLFNDVNKWLARRALVPEYESHGDLLCSKPIGSADQAIAPVDSSDNRSISVISVRSLRSVTSAKEPVRKKSLFARHPRFRSTSNENLQDKKSVRSKLHFPFKKL